MKFAMQATWRSTSSVVDGRIRLGFNIAGGAVGIDLDVANAASLAATLNDYLQKSQSPISSGIPNSDVSPQDGVHVAPKE